MPAQSNDMVGTENIADSGGQVARQIAAILSVLTLLCLFVGSGCSDFGSPFTPPELPPPDTTVSFQRQVLPIFTASCSDGSDGSCHVPCSPRNRKRLCLAEYDSLMNHRDSLVIRGNSQESELVKRIEGRSNPRMPYRRLPLADSVIQLIRLWIDQGAKNN